MTILYLMVPAALLLGSTALAVFLWAARTGQYDDLVTPAHRALLPDSFKAVQTETRTTTETAIHDAT